MTAVACLVLFAALLLGYITGLQLIPERAGVVTANEKYVVDAKFFVKRYGRRDNYYINVEGTTKHTWSNNVSVHMIFYEYLHNEYKRSFVEMHFKFCDMINKDPYAGRAVAASGIICPMLAGPHRAMNLSIPLENFPNVWPFERCRIDIKAHQLPSDELMFNIELFVIFKQKNGK